MFTVRPPSLLTQLPPLNVKVFPSTVTLAVAVPAAATRDIGTAQLRANTINTPAEVRGCMMAPALRMRDCNASTRLFNRLLLRSFRLARTVEGDCLANERLEGGLIDFLSFVDIDRAACGSLEARVEETGRIL
jgi:hypothetical protein